MCRSRSVPGRPVTGSRRVAAVAALVVYCAVMISLTMLKAFFVIGLLWRPEAQRGRSVEWLPLAEALRGGSWFAPLFDGLGNIAFFVPFGVLLYVLVDHHSRAVLRVTLSGAALSLGIEVAQYVFALGHSDVGDLVFNTLGAAVGGWIARLCGHRAYPVWIGLALALGAVFTVLVILGERLGDPQKVVELR